MGASSPTMPDGAFSAVTEAHGRALVVRIFGEIDIASAKAFEKEIQSAFDSDAEAVLLDLGEVSFIDSTGLCTLLAAAEKASVNGDRLRIVRISPPVQRSFEITGLERSFPLAD
jgi:anti-sigma B factor antagonist